MASSSYSSATFCGAGAEGKTGEELLDHFREFVGKVWDSESPTGMALVLRPTEMRGDVLQTNDSFVCFFTVEQLKQWSPKAYVAFEPYSDETQAALVHFSKQKLKGGGVLNVKKRTTKATVVKWLAQLQLDTCAECVVCYEETGTGSARLACICPICAAMICVQCYIDIALDAEIVDAIRAVRCPLCGYNLEMTFLSLCRSTDAHKTLSEAHKEFVHFWYYVNTDFSRTLRCDFAKMTAKMRHVVEVDSEEYLHMCLRLSKAKLMESRTRDERLEHRYAVKATKYSLETYPPLLRRALRECETAKVKTEMKSASDDSIASGSAVRKRVRSDRCARCQKVFWDKKEKKRAPKCPKCKRVAYCSGACRKKHKRAHSLQCVAGAKAKRKKKAAAKDAKLYGP